MLFSLGDQLRAQVEAKFRIQISC
uniref:Uncharacterized protein n=1 Tax=Arundo donax TaxID=35708 RepID=A0A0A9AW01_ARUDO